MSKAISYEMDYAAPVEKVWEMLRTPAFREDVCRYQGVSEVTVDIDGTADTMTVKIDQLQPTAGIPSFAKKIVGDQTNVVQEETWTDGTHGDITVTIPGKPGDIRGTAVLVGDGATTVETVTLTIKVHIPLIGGKLEGLIGELLLKALRAEHHVGRDHLSG